MAETGASYGQILRSSSIMGAAAAVNLLLGMVRVKFAAVLIGTLGTGLLANFTSIQLLATNIFGLGIQSSGVRTLAAAVAANDSDAVSRAALTLRRLCLLTGLVGMAATAMLSPIFSQITFGSDRYALDIAALGLVVLFTNLSGGQMALIQGMRRIGDIARINLLSAAAATAAAITFYGFFGTRGIVPALVSTAGFQLAISWLYARSIPLTPISFGWSESLRESGGMIRLGFVFMWNGLLGSAVSYATITLITQQVSLQAAGLFSAAFALSGIFVSFILGAMGADYYPRLTGAAAQPSEFRRLVNEQTEVGLLLALPGLIATMTLAPWAIWIFYTGEFQAAASLLHWFVLGCLGRVLSWPLGFVMPALGKERWFFVTETVGNLFHLMLIVVGIRVFGLVGVAVAFFLLYVAYTIAVFAVARRLTGFSWSRDSVLLIVLSCGLLFTCLVAVKYLSLWPATVLGLGASLATSVFSLRQLTRRLGEDHKLTRMAARLPFSAPPAVRMHDGLGAAHTSNMQSAPIRDTQPPLATFILLSYNQEQFIRHAVRGALSQTYEPLEIIISDDCSTDRTFELAQEMVQAYSGPHKVRLNRNPSNMGISRHVRYLQEIAEGEIIIHAGGDDISYPERTARIVNAFRSEARTPSLVMSNAHVIDEDGNVLGLFSTPEHPIREENASPTDFTSAGGAGTFAVHRGLVTMFPPPADKIYGEDRILLFRAKLADGTLYIPDVLVQYRVSRYGVWSSGFIGSLGTDELLQRQVKRAKDYIHIMDQGASDVRTIAHPNAAAILEEIEQIVETKRNWVDVLSGSLRRSFLALVAELFAGRITGELAKLYLMRWMPWTRTLKLRLTSQRRKSEDLRSHPAVQVPRRE